MLKPILLTAMAAALAVGTAFASQDNGKVIIPVNKTSPSSGKQMYSNYCAPCHGVDGKGQGPVAPALKVPPTDLTVLARNHNGKFPDTHVITVLENGAEMPVHGTAQMPVWGPILGRMDVSNPQAKTLRMSNLSRYLETLQVK
jgi:mono/diheme cytochrome c family protein